MRSNYKPIQRYDRLLPGNSNTLFLKGVARDGKHDRHGAAQHYYDCLQIVRRGKAAEHTYSRLTTWGHIN